MAATPFEIEISVKNPDAASAWIRENFPGAVKNFKALEEHDTGRWRCTLIGDDDVIATTIKLYWDGQDA